jgi:hypothetical protein
VDFGPKLSCHLCPSHRCCAPISATAHCNWSCSWSWTSRSSTRGRSHRRRAWGRRAPPSRALLRSPLPPLRSRSHQEWRTGESITVYSGEPPLWARHVIAVALPLPAELPRVVRPGVNSWDPIPLHDLISCVHLRFHDSRWSGPFKGLWTKVPWTRSTAPWTYSMRFSLEK